MSKDTVTIAAAQAQKHRLELTIKGAIQGFESDTGLLITDIKVTRVTISTKADTYEQTTATSVDITVLLPNKVE